MEDEKKSRIELIHELKELRKQVSRNKNRENEHIKKLIKIKEELELFKTIFELSNEAIAVSDASGNLVYINPAHEKLFGKSLEEARKLNYRDYYPPESVEILNNVVASALSRGEGWEGELDVYDKEGKTFPLWERAGSILDEQGNFEYAFGFMHDITEKKQINNDLRASEERYRELVNNMSSGVAVYEVTPEGDNFIFKEFNKAGEEIEHVRKEELIGRKVTDVFPGVIKFGLFDVFKRVYKTGIPEYHPISLYKDNRTIGWRENYVYKLSNNEIVAVYQDVTEKKKIETELQESHQIMESIFNNTHILIAYMDNEFNFIKVNQKYAAADNKEQDFFVGKNHFDLYPDEEIKTIFSRVVDTGVPYFCYSKPFEYIHNKERGISYWDWSIVPIKDKKGIVTSLILSILNVTERVKFKNREKLYFEILELINTKEDMKRLIEVILQKIKAFTGFEAVGIRLKQGRDYPYYVTNGFPTHFVEAERYLCSNGSDNKCDQADSDIDPVLECMCGNIIRGRVNPDLSFFTTGGSFWSNNTSVLLTETTEEDRQTRTRNRCNSEGYESVALIPVRYQEQVIGLIQFNDHKTNRFTLEIIEFFEKIGSTIGIAFSKMKDQEQLVTSIFEKEVLIQEIHHRVKNNLQVISSLIGLQMMKTGNKGSLSALSDIKTRIYTMSLLHQILYQKENLTEIDMMHYVNDISLYLVQSLKANSDKIDIAVMVKNVHLNLEKALPCGLIINEVVSNSIKYAFCEKYKGKITIEIFKNDENINMHISDDGIGLPENLDIKTADSLGLSLIYSFTDQLDGTIEVNRGNGTEYKITFPL